MLGVRHADHERMTSSTAGIATAMIPLLVSFLVMAASVAPGFAGSGQGKGPGDGGPQAGQGKGQGSGGESGRMGGGARSGSVRSVLQGAGREVGSGGGDFKGSAAVHGTKVAPKSSVVAAEEEENPDKRGPKYSGGKTPGPPAGSGTKKGDVFGDMWVILRDENGVPILNADGFVQPLDANGNLIPLDAEGAPLDGSLVVEVELGRINLARAPGQVLDRALEEVVKTLNTATAITTDAAGRLVVTIDGVQKTIDSPRENLAIYKTLMSTGMIPGLTVADSVLGDLASLKTAGLTESELAFAAVVLAGTSDKYTSISIDTVIYLNTILGITGTITGPDGRSYVDYSAFDYSRSTTYDGTVTYLKLQPDGSYLPVTGTIMDVVFSGTDFSSTDGGVDGFAKLADDARSVISFVHDNSIPQ